jgi:FAD:protein FMN transferase
VLSARSLLAEPVGTWEVRTVSSMGSRAHLIAGDSSSLLDDWAIPELERLEQCWSRFRPTSELVALRDAAGRWIDISPTLEIALRKAQVLHRSTGGWFDPTVDVSALGYDRTFPSVDLHCGDAPRYQPALGADRLELGEGCARLALGATLDLGGLGKGLAADLIATGLLERGARSACISMGGDIRAVGNTPIDGPWQIPVENPNHHGVTLGTVGLAEAAIVTSTTAYRRWRRDGQELHHLVDPRTGRPSANGVRAVVVIADEACWAEGMAKAALVAGVHEGRRLLERHGLGGWLVGDDESVTATTWAPSMTIGGTTERGVA